VVEKLPTRLSSEPLAEVVCEVRFEAAGDTTTNLLPGIFHDKLGPFDSLNRLFALPPGIPLADEALAFRPQLQLLRENLIVQIGPRSVSVNNVPPYRGWKAFCEYVQKVFNVLSEQTFITGYSWLSLKYVDILQLDSSPRLSWLNASIVLANRKIESENHVVRAEFRDGKWLTVVQVVGAVKRQGDERTGLLVDVDVIYQDQLADFRGQFPGLLGELHQRNKAEFFGLLTPETLRRLGPEY
jgi:uncharacterized protein (TIGR04255 family)